ncbi:PIN domain-containing protein [Salinarimonas sp.]|uniref:PIN domain-containing protein n=1 Tax=Salinarimonas sp. TaxID=2766526 RepID=UPI0032D940FF
MKYLLDTHVLSDLIRNPRTSPVRTRIAEVGEHAVFTSPFVACELRFGAAKRNAPRLTAAVDEILRRLKIADLDPLGFPPVYADLRVRLERVGKPVGAMDLLIASHALSLGACLVTHNLREFERVQGLHVESWL